MAIVWDVGTALTGSGEVAATGRYCRAELTTIPAYLTSSGSSPVLYRNLGLIGPVVGSARQLGDVLQWPTQIIGPLPDVADTIWYRLVAGVSGTLYRGVEVSNDIAIACQVYNSAVQAISNNTLTAVTFDLEASDPWGMHSPSSNPTRVTVPTPGWYDLTGRVTWNNNGTGSRALNLRVNGATTVGGSTQSVGGLSGDWLTQEAVSRVFLNAGDYVELMAYQSSGGSLNLNVNNPMASSLTVIRIPG